LLARASLSNSLIKQIGRLAKTRKDVVIIGEAGVGKGAIAKNIYFQSKTGIKEQPFMSINLSVLDDKELEAVLFRLRQRCRRAAVHFEARAF
jgi:transcriptional regulator with AAA-type ATPase domain